MKRKYDDILSDDESKDPSYTPCKHQLHASKRRRTSVSSQEDHLDNEQMAFVEKARNQQSCMHVPSNWLGIKALFRELIAIRADYLLSGLSSIRNDTTLLRLAIDKQPDFLYANHKFFQKTWKNNGKIVKYALQRHGNTLRYALYYRDLDTIPREWMDMALENDVRAIVHLPVTFRYDTRTDTWYETWFRKCFEQHPDLFWTVPHSLVGDRVLAARALKYNVEQNVMYINGALLHDKQFVTYMIREQQCTALYGHITPFNPLSKDADIQMALIGMDPHLLSYIRCPASMDVIRAAVKQSGVALMAQCHYLTSIVDSNVKQVYELVLMAIRTQFRTHKYTLLSFDRHFENFEHQCNECSVLFWCGRPISVQNEWAYQTLMRLCLATRTIHDATTYKFNRKEHSHRELITPLAFYHKLFNKNSAIPPLQDMMQLIDEAICMDPRAIHYIPNCLYKNHFDQMIDLLCRHARSIVTLYPNWRCDITDPLHNDYFDCSDSNLFESIQTTDRIQPQFVRQINNELMRRDDEIEHYDVYRRFFFALSTWNMMSRLTPRYASLFKDVILVLQQ